MAFKRLLVSTTLLPKPIVDYILEKVDHAETAQHGRGHSRLREGVESRKLRRLLAVDEETPNREDSRAVPLLEVRPDRNEYKMLTKKKRSEFLPSGVWSGTTTCSMILASRWKVRYQPTLVFHFLL